MKRVIIHDNSDNSDHSIKLMHDNDKDDSDTSNPSFLVVHKSSLGLDEEKIGTPKRVAPLFLGHLDVCFLLFGHR